jgi:mitochondrial fission protein ELM1
LSSPTSKPLIVWRFIDGKRGHESQSAGLCAALGRLARAEVHDVPAAAPPAALLDLIARRYAAGAALPDPDLLVGAGHRTHLPMLAARRARGGRIVVLMRPSLPFALFDLCIVPAHDGVAPRANVLVTDGALNPVVDGDRHETRRGLILVGGLSPHFQWQGAAVIRQIETIVAADAGLQWQIADSRRTPPATSRALVALERPNVQFTGIATTGPDWLAGELARAAVVWVTADSVSMIYEALTAGAAVGLIGLPAAGRSGRLADGIRRLVQERRVTPYADWQRGVRLAPPERPLKEAERCARLLLDHWFKGIPTAPS